MLVVDACQSFGLFLQGSTISIEFVVKTISVIAGGLFVSLDYDFVHYL